MMSQRLARQSLADPGGHASRVRPSGDDLNVTLGVEVRSASLDGDRSQVDLAQRLLAAKSKAPRNFEQLEDLLAEAGITASRIRSTSLLVIIGLVDGAGESRAFLWYLVRIQPRPTT